MVNKFKLLYSILLTLSLISLSVALKTIPKKNLEICHQNFPEVFEQMIVNSDQMGEVFAGNISGELEDIPALEKAIDQLTKASTYVCSYEFFQFLMQKKKKFIQDDQESFGCSSEIKSNLCSDLMEADCCVLQWELKELEVKEKKIGQIYQKSALSTFLNSKSRNRIISNLP